MNIELLVPLLGEWLAKGMAVLFLAISIVSLWRQSSAAQRHLVWLAALATLLLLPATRLVAPRWKVSLAPPVQAVLPAATLRMAPINATPAVVELDGSTPPSNPWQLPGWRMLLVGIWGAGVAGLLGYRLLGSWRLRRIERGSIPLDDPRMIAAAEGIFLDLRLRQKVTIRISPECRVPMTWGIWKAVLILPDEARNWSETRLAAALRHEAGHIWRRDYFVRWIAHLACALYWPNPLVWLAARSLRAAQEQATDDLVLRAGTPAEEYAAQLFDAARTVATHGLFAHHAVAMATPSTLENRVLAIVDERRDRRPLSRPVALAGSTLVAVALAICTIAQLRGADPTPAAAADGAADAAQPQVLIQARFLEFAIDPSEIDGGLATDKSIYADPQYQDILRKVSQRKDVDILSAPRVTTRSNQSALIEVARDFRYPKDWTKNAQGQWEPSAFDTTKVGVTLDAKPVVNADGSVDLNLKPSVVEFVGFADLDASKDAPGKAPLIPDPLAAPNGKRMKSIFSERTVETVIRLQPGETVALAALQEKGGEKAAGRNAHPGKLVIFVSASVVELVADSGKDASAQVSPVENTQAQPSAEKDAASIIIPKMEFREATIREAVAFLRKKSKELSPDGRGVNIVLKLPEGDERQVNLTLTNIPVIEAVRYVAQLAHLNLTVQPDALVLGDVSAAEAPPAGPSAALTKARAISIPQLECVDASVPEVLNFLRLRSRELDPDKQGINLVLDQPPGSKARISLKLSNIPVAEVLRYVASLADLEMIAEPQAIVLRPPKKDSGLGPKSAGTDGSEKTAAPRDKPADIPEATNVPGKPGFVFSPYDAQKGYIDVRGFPAGTEVKDPYSGKSFLVPKFPGGENQPKDPEPPSRVPGNRAKPGEPPPGASLIQPGSKPSRIEGRAGIEMRQSNAAVDLIPTRRPGGF